MNKLEHFFKDNRKGFDKMNVEPSVWQNIAKSLDAPPQRTSALRISWLMGIAATLLLVFFALLFWPSQQQEQLAHLNVGLDINERFPDISLRNPEGEPVALSSLKGKVVLVEFWASYSKVCTEDHCYYFKPAYNTFKDKGFEIYAISVDSSAANWLQAIERDELDWLQVADLDGTQSQIARDFMIESLPTTYLLDGEGRIIAKDIEAHELEYTLSQLFAYNK